MAAASPISRFARRPLIRFGSILAALVVVAGCHQGDAPTEPRVVDPTPTPPALDLSGTWSGHFTSPTGVSEPVRATVTQTGTRVEADWTLAVVAKTHFAGTLERDRLSGKMFIEHGGGIPGCTIHGMALKGSATSNRIELDGMTLCRFDPFRVSMVLTR